MNSAPVAPSAPAGEPAPAASADAPAPEAGSARWSLARSGVLTLVLLAAASLLLSGLLWQKLANIQ